MTFLWFLLITSTLALVYSAPNVDRKRHPSWFDLQPFMRQSKSQTGRALQKKRKRR